MKDWSVAGKVVQYFDFKKTNQIYGFNILSLNGAIKFSCHSLRVELLGDQSFF